MKKIVAALLLLAIAAGGGWAYMQYQAGSLPTALSFLEGRQNKAAAAAAPGGGQFPPVAVEAVPVEVGTVSRQIEAIGTLRSNESIVIRPEIAGRIVAISFEEGQRVAKGQLLVKLDDAVYKAQREQALANLQLSKANRERAQKLYSQGAGTERARDEAEAQLRADMAAIALAEAQLAKTEIVAPFDGIVGLRKVSAGAYVTAGEDIANLESIEPLKVDFRIPEIYLSSLELGQQLAVTADAFPGRTFAGTVFAIDPLVDENGRSVLLRARVPNPDLVLRPGLFVRVTLVIEEVRNAILVPEEALVPRGQESLVYKVQGDEPRAVPVKVGMRRGGKVQIVDGLAPGDVVVTAGQMKLRPGAKVAVIPPKSGA